MADESARETQLRGKPLVFLFMSVTVLAVVIFLCGVMVGRGVRAPQVEQALAAGSVDPTAATDAVQTPAPSGNPASAQGEDLQYPKDLVGPAPVEGLPSEPPVPASDAEPAVEREPGARAEPPVTTGSRAAAAPEAAEPDPADFREPAGNGFVVQVHAARQQSEANAVARRLTSKGYPAFVTTSGTGAARMFRVRVGKFDERREAESVSRRLETEEQFKPWITR